MISFQLATMSDDDEEVIFTAKRSRTLHYGSLQEQEERRNMGPNAIQAGITAGNINISSGNVLFVVWVLFVLIVSISRLAR